MQPDGFGYRRRKAAREPGASDPLMFRIGGPIGEVVRDILDEVSHIVQQGGDDQRRRRSGFAGKMRGLQTVLGHRNAFAEIGFGPAPRIKREYFVNDRHGCSPDRAPGAILRPYCTHCRA